MKFIDSVEAQEYYIQNSKRNLKIKFNEDYSYSFSEISDDEDSLVIQEIQDLGYYEDWVYDLETEMGTFQAGVGEMIVKNTDSVFLHYKKYKKINLKDKETISQILEECFQVGEQISQEATKMFKKPILLEFEKVYFPFISFGKKMYTGIMYEPPETKKGKIDSKGIVEKRRDNPNITKKVFQGIRDIIFKEGYDCVKNSVNYLNAQIDTILNNQVPIEDLVLTKTYKTNYKAENIPHKILAEKMKARDPGSAPKTNDRVPYIFIETKNIHDKQYQKVEHPDYAREHGLKIDSLYYMDQIKNPIVQLLSPLMDPKEISKIFDVHKRDYLLKKSGQKKITHFFPKVKKP